MINFSLIECVGTVKFFGDFVVDVLNSVKNTLAEIAGLVSVPHFKGFVLAR